MWITILWRNNKLWPGGLCCFSFFNLLGFQRVLGSEPALLSLGTIAPQHLLALFSVYVRHPIKWEAFKSTEAPGIARAVLIFCLLCSCGQLVFYRWRIAWWIFRTFILTIRKGSLFKNPHQLCVVSPKLFEPKIPYWNSLSSDKVLKFERYHY